MAHSRVRQLLRGRQKHHYQPVKAKAVRSGWRERERELCGCFVNNHLGRLSSAGEIYITPGTLVYFSRFEITTRLVLIIKEQIGIKTLGKYLLMVLNDIS